MIMKDLTLLLIAGGKSSRFGGEPKMLSKIGPNEETLFEMSISQMMYHVHIVQIHVVVNKENKDKIMEEVKRVNQKHDICRNITFNIQEIPGFRTKPWGTADAVSSAKGHIHTPFLLLNSDDLYDSKTFQLVGEQCDLSKNYIIGFTLGSTLSGNQKANRAFISVDKEEKVVKLQEKLNIERDYYNKYELENQYVSVNLLLLQPSVLSSMDQELNDFKYQHMGDASVEALLPNFLNSLMKQDILSMELFKTSGQWNGVTYKDDVQSVREVFLSPRKEH